MAHLLRFRKPINLGDVTMDYIFNVSNRVGPNQPNQRDDVLLVQFLLREYMTRPELTGSPLFPLPTVSGDFDIPTALWIYYQQLLGKKQNPTAILDGIVSPARGIFYNTKTGDSWYIANLNYSLKSSNSRRFDAMRDDPIIKPIIKRQITV
jgi:hypothetical protein